MKQEFIGATPITNVNETINKFLSTTGIDYFEDEKALQNAVEFVKELGFDFDIDDCEACISGGSLEPFNIPSFGDTNKEATFLALDVFAKLKNENKIG